MTDDTIHAEDVERLLDEGCCNPNCKDPHCGDSLIIGGTCHPKKGVKIIAYKTDDRLQVVCSVCGKHIGWLQLARRGTAFSG